MTKPIVKSIALYPHDGIASIRRRYSPEYPPVSTEPWPTIEVGQEVEIHDAQGWRWQAVVESLKDGEDEGRVRVVGDKEALPFPEVTDGRLVLPNMSGHAHVRFWAKGDIVKIGETPYKVTHKPKPFVSHTKVEYRLEPATERQYVTRPGKVRMPDRRSALEAIGSAVQTITGEWLHAKKAVYRKYGSAEGELFGVTWLVTGKHVPAEKAANLNEVHGPMLARDLAAAGGIRVQTPMPDDATVLVPKDPTSRSVTGERVAVVNGSVLHERVGDPDQLDSRYHYLVKVDDKVLVKRVQRFIKAAGKK